MKAVADGIEKGTFGMTEKQLIQAIRQVIKDNYLGKRINFGEPGRFKVNKYNIRSRKTICPKYEYEDYGIDEDTQRFIIVEFYDQKDDLFAIGSCCCIFTLNSKGQFGTSDIPFDYELDGAYDFAINNMTDKILQYINNNF